MATKGGKVDKSKSRIKSRNTLALKEKELREVKQISVAMNLQRMLRGNKVRRAMTDLAFLEDEVLKFPRPGLQAAHILLTSPPPTPSPDEEPAPEAAVQNLNATLKLPDASKQARVPSKNISKKAASEAGSYLSQPRSLKGSKSGSATSDVLVDDAPISVPEDALARRFDQAGSSRPTEAARLIYWLLADPGLLTSKHMEQIFVHHRLRRRNNSSRVIMRLTLVVHGDVDQSTKTGLVGDPVRPLTTEGQMQVTRAGWALRLHPNFSPGLVLISSETSSVQTYERLRSIMGDDSDDDLMQEPEPTPPPSDEAKMKRERLPRPPKARLCDALNFPGFWKTMGPESYRVVDAIVDAMTEWFPGKDHIPLAGGHGPDPPTPVMLVGSAHLLETVLACICGASRRLDEAGGRMGGGGKMCGGDAIVVQSPALSCLAGEEFDEYYRTPSELWEEAFKRMNWTVVQHIRGNGRPSERPMVMTSSGWMSPDEIERLEAAEKASMEIERALAGGNVDSGDLEAEDGVSTDMPGRDIDKTPVVSEFGRQWRQYTGEPLIFSHDEFSVLVQRAGSRYRKMPTSLMRALRPLVRHVRLEPEYEEGSIRSGSSSRRTPAGSGLMASLAMRSAGSASAPDLNSARSGRSNRSNRSKGSNRSVRAGQAD